MRLTRKCKETPYTPEMYDFNIVDNKPVSNHDIIDKLGQLEDIEEELGIDLITLFKALKNGFYYKGTNFGKPNDIYFADPTNEECGIECYEPNSYGITWATFGVAYTKDYGKTWALTEVELLWTL